MPLRLKIENETSLPDGGPVSYTLSGKRGMDIGRDQYLDWVLPDPTRVVSGKHCEIRFRDGSYWLQDVSTNGTFINSNEQRVQGIHRLENGDRVEIGRYIISVAIEGEESNGQNPGHATQETYPDSASVWQVGGDVPPPINPRELKTPKVASGMRSLDVLDWASDIPVLPPDPLPSVQPVYSPPPPTPTRPMPAISPSAWDSDEPSPLPLTRPMEPQPAPAPAPSAAPAADWLVDPAPQPPAELPAQELPPVEAAVPPMEMPTAEAPAPASEQVRAPVDKPRMPQATGLSNDSELIRRFAAAAGIPEAVIAAQDAGALLEQLGALMRTMAENLQQLQTARAQSKGIMRSANQTLIQATDNNPLRFSPTSGDALKIMFGPPTSGYLDAKRSIESSFNDLKKHQLATFTAMQDALQELFSELDPKNVTAASGSEGGVSLLGSKKARYWDLFVTRWQAKVGKHERGMLGVFMQLFAEAYDKR